MIKKLYTLKEIKEFKKLFVRARDNLTLTIEKFPGWSWDISVTFLGFLSNCCISDIASF
jgi:hypothetical protein